MPDNAASSFSASMRFAAAFVIDIKAAVAAIAAMATAATAKAAPVPINPNARKPLAAEVTAPCASVTALLASTTPC